MRARTEIERVCSLGEGARQPKAMLQDRYGSPDDVLELREIAMVVVKDGVVLVQVNGHPGQRSRNVKPGAHVHTFTGGA